LSIKNISPLAPQSYSVMLPVSGVEMATMHAGIKYRNPNRLDLLLCKFVEGTKVAGVFTKSKTASANITWGRQALNNGNARCLIVNSGNANAFNGKNGEDSVERIVNNAAKLLNCDKYSVYPCATGVIGEPLADDKITDSLDYLLNNLQNDCWEKAAKAIMTTDTFHKMVSVKTNIAAVPITISAIAKGSGMVAPDMATMLSYIFTDANIDQVILQKLLFKYCDLSFNNITVDSDTSTSDTALLFATCQADQPIITDIDDPNFADFKTALRDLMIELAHMIVKDGEGATKFITINVKGAVSDQSAKKIALSVGNSPLVKTAMAGSDANWGRIVMAVGKSGEEADRDKLTIGIGSQILANNGQLNPDYREENITDYMQGENIVINIDLGLASGSATIWTCDLTHGYISINADYRS
ncbi:MAG: bifunctional glutamate N-acetyltransferase/amino-acid acetyltransferase ArgJ, partial [Pseudomonadota bacterium]